jgi:hypothetical protein
MSNQYNDALITDIQRATSGETLDAEKNAALFERVAAGDAAAREEMIVGNMPLAVAKVESFIRCFPRVAHLRDDLTSAAFTGLVKAVNQMAEGCDIKDSAKWNPTDCIGSWINRELGRLTEDETCIRVPHTSKDRARTEGEELTPPLVGNAIPERFEVPSYEKELEMRDLIDSCCNCVEERTFVAMREARHTLVEIAVAIHKTRMFTQRMGRELDARVQRKLKAVRDE